MSFSPLSAIAVVSFLSFTSAHMSIWAPCMYGQRPDRFNTDRMSQPLQNMKFSEWWMHGVQDQPSPDGAVCDLPANGFIQLDMASNKGHTPMSGGYKDDDPTQSPEPWKNENGWGNMHAPKRDDVAGSALGIAYKSDIYKVLPTDFVIFSVAYDSPARQRQSFEIPDLPPCPDGKCICAWFWIHKSIGGTDQMYMTPFDCKVTGAQNPRRLGRPVPPIKCGNNDIPCVSGAKSPMYWKNKEGNNMLEQGQYAPTYNGPYGFRDGAQSDIFQDGSGNPRANEVYECGQRLKNGKDNCYNVDRYPSAF